MRDLRQRERWKIECSISTTYHRERQTDIITSWAPDGANIVSKPICRRWLRWWLLLVRFMNIRANQIIIITAKTWPHTLWDHWHSQVWQLVLIMTVIKLDAWWYPILEGGHKVWRPHHAWVFSLCQAQVQVQVRWGSGEDQEGQKQVSSSSKFKDEGLF